MTLEFIVQVAIAGFLGTYVHLILALWAGQAGLPRIDLSRGMANMTFGKSFEGEPPYLLGAAVIHINGIIFALIYATVVAQYLPGDPFIKGGIFGFILWIIAMLFFVPVFFKDGFFGLKMGKWGWITALIVHVVYGIIVGWLSPVAHTMG